MAFINHDVEENPITGTDFEPIPVGWYEARVSNSVVETAKSGNGTLLKLTFEILDPKYPNRKVWDQFWLEHTNPMARQIGRGRLSALCKAVGRPGMVEDSEELHDVPFLLKLGIEKSEGYEPKNVTKGYEPAKKARAAVVVEASKADDDNLPF